MIVPQNVVQQISDSPYEHSQFVQVSYSAGRIADFWRDLYIVSKSKFQRTLEKALGQSISKPVMCHWNNGIHTFRNGFGFDLNDTVRKCLVPNAKKYPGLFMVGESYSMYQGWAEGCIQTGDDVIQLLQEGTVQKTKRSVTSECVEINDRVINIGKWKFKHPGGKAILINNLLPSPNNNTIDLISKVRCINHSNYALSTMFYLSDL